MRGASLTFFQTVQCEHDDMVDYIETPGEPGGTYVDQVRVVYRSIDGHVDATTHATVVLISDTGMAVDRDRLRHEIERLHYTPNPVPGGEPVHQSFESEERLHTTSWGAAGAVWELFMQVPSEVVHAIVGGVAYDGLRRVAKRLRELKGPAVNLELPDAEEAQRRAIQMAHAAWPDLANPLIVLSCSLDRDSATVVLRAPDHSVITAKPTMTVFDAIGPITRVYPETS